MTTVVNVVSRCGRTIEVHCLYNQLDKTKLALYNQYYFACHLKQL